MSAFPKLKTGAIAQYPAIRALHFSTAVRRFLDSSEQAYRDLGSSRRRWVIDLSQLDESELATLSNFFQEQQGRFGSFDFEDPWTGTVVSGCRFEEDSLTIRAEGELDGGARLTVVE